MSLFNPAGQKQKKKEKWEKEKEPLVAEAFFYILLHYFAMPEAGSWVGDPAQE